MKEELWVELNHYPNYAVSNKGRVLNMRLNRVLDGTIVGGRRVVSVKSDEGYFHQFSTDRLQALVDFSNGMPNLTTRKIKVVETGIMYDSVALAAKGFRTDSSTIYKALNGVIKTVMGVKLEYVYD